MLRCLVVFGAGRLTGMTRYYFQVFLCFVSYCEPAMGGI